MSNDAYKSGNDAFWLGHRIVDCPYSLNSEDAAKWSDGWLDAQYSYQRLFEYKVSEL